MAYYCRVKAEAPGKSKFRRLSKRLELNCNRAGFGLAVSVWCLCWQHEFTDGRLKDFDAEDIARELEWKGEPNELVEALLAEHILEREKDGTFVVHDWVEEQYGGIKIMERNRNRGKAPAAAPAAPAEDAPAGDDTVAQVLMNRMKECGITGSASQKREHIESWRIRKLAQKAEEIIMGPGKGQDIFTIGKMVNGKGNGESIETPAPLSDITKKFNRFFKEKKT